MERRSGDAGSTPAGFFFVLRNLRAAGRLLMMAAEPGNWQSHIKPLGVVPGWLFYFARPWRLAMRARTDLDFLLYPLATEEEPTCSACGAPMTIAVHEARGDRPDFSTFRCRTCTRSERFVLEN
jgi:hypothetical protein